MLENLVIALWITLIGMGLVFLAILLLWGAMALLLMLTETTEKTLVSRQKQDQKKEEAAEQESESKKVCRQKAAAVAVALALVQQGKAQDYADTAVGDAPHVPPTLGATTVSAWQTVARSNIHGK